MAPIAVDANEHLMLTALAFRRQIKAADCRSGLSAGEYRGGTGGSDMALCRTTGRIGQIERPAENVLVCI